jgi:hypothetical protein
MWIFMNNAFFSIVQNRDEPKQVLVRSRVKQDLLNAFGDHEVIEMDDSDYRFRMFLDKEFVSEQVKSHIQNINYDNFKNSISKDDQERKSYYMRVWEVMYAWQAKYFGGVI